MSPMTPRFLLLTLLSASFAADAVAQQFDRRSRDEPEIVVEAGGRVGTCDALLFSPDGKFLLAGGDDKVVRVWPYSAAGGLDTEKGKAQTLRWRAWREQRGGIKAVATQDVGSGHEGFGGFFPFAGGDQNVGVQNVNLVAGNGAFNDIDGSVKAIAHQDVGSFHEGIPVEFLAH